MKNLKNQKASKNLIAILTIGLLFFWGIIIFQSCEKNDTEEKLNTEELKSQNKSLVELRSIREEITKKVIGRKIPTEDLREAYLNDDIDKIKSLMGFTEAELIDIESRLNKSRITLLKKYPKLVDYYSSIDNSCSICTAKNKKDKINQFFDNYNSYIDFGKSRKEMNKTSVGSIRLMSSNVEGNEGDCQWGQYTACLLVCTTAGPVLYWPCAFICYCSFCEDSTGICDI